MSKNKHSGQSRPQFGGVVTAQQRVSNSFVPRKIKESRAPSQRIILAKNPQPEVLKKYMDKAGLSHGETVIANLKNVRITREGELYLCPMERLEIVKTVNAGDGGKIPEEIMLTGTLIAKNFFPGHFNLNYAGVSSNGRMQIIVMPDTMLEKTGV